MDPYPHVPRDLRDSDVISEGRWNWRPGAQGL